MFKEKKYQDNGNGGYPYIFRDEATKEKIKRHISDINDVISENDIKNARIPGIDKQTHGAGDTLKGGGSAAVPINTWDIVD